MGGVMDKIGFIEDFCSTVLSRPGYITEDEMVNFRISAALIKDDIAGKNSNWYDYSREMVVNYVLSKIRVCSQKCREIIELLIVDYCPQETVH
jgi:hypothetical protein